MIALESGDLDDSRGAEKRVSNTRFLPTLCHLRVYVKYEIYCVCIILSELRPIHSINRVSPATIF